MAHKQKPNTTGFDDKKMQSTAGACHPHEMDVVGNGYRPPMRRNPKKSTSHAATNRMQSWHERENRSKEKLLACTIINAVVLFRPLRPSHFHLTPRIAKNWPGLSSETVYGCTHMPMYLTERWKNTLCMYNMDVGSNQRWSTPSTMTSWHHFYSTVTQNCQN